MGRKNYNSFLKYQKAEKKRKKKVAKREKLKERKSHESNGELKDMIAWVDEEGNIVEEPPEDQTGLKENEAGDE